MAQTAGAAHPPDASCLTTRGLSQGVPTVAVVTVAVRLTPYGPPAFEALCEALEASRVERGHLLAPATVVVGDHRLGIATRRALARRGMIGVDCLTLRQLAELLAGDALAAEGRRPVSAAVLAGTVRRVLQTSAAGVFAEVREHLSTERALAEAHRTLRDLSSGELAALERASARAADVVAISRQVRRRLRDGGFHDERDLLDVATAVVLGEAEPLGAGSAAQPADPDRAPGRLVGSSPAAPGGGRGSAARAGPGPVLLYLPQRLGPAALDLLGALARTTEGLVVIAGVCGAPEADAPVSSVVRRLAGPEAWQPPVVPTPAPHRILAVPDADEEVRTALRGVVEGLRQGIALERMAVLYGRGDPYSRLLHDQLLAADLPFSGPSVRPLAESAMGRFLLGLLGLPARRFSRHDVMAWLSSAPVRASLDTGEEGAWRPVPVAAWERISRRAGVLHDSEEWARRLDAYCANRRAEIGRLGEDSDWRQAQIQRDIALAESLRRFMERILERVEAAAEMRSWRGLARWAERSVRDLVGGEAWRGDNWPAHECTAAGQIESALERLGGLDRVDPEPDLPRFRRALEAELSDTRVRQGRAGHGLLVGPVDAALGADLDRVWVLGLAEGVFPGLAVEDSLLSETERAAVPGALAPPSARLADDHRHYLAALSAASGERTLLFPRGDLRRTAERLPSRWLLESAQALLPGADSAVGPSAITCGGGDADGETGRILTAEDLAKLPGEVFTEVPSATSALRTCAFPATREEYDLRLLLDHRSDGRFLDEHPLAAPGSALARPAALLAARRSDTFTRFDGNLAGCAVPGPADAGRVVSATQLETWAACPHGYFMRYLLGVEPVDQPERELRISPIERGDLIHTILDRFFREVLAAGAPDPEAPWGVGERRRLEQIAEEAFAEREGQGRVGQRIFWEPERRRIRRELLAFLDADEELRRVEGCRPWASEKGFAMPPRRIGEEPLPPVEVPLGDGRTIRLRGAVDRIDSTSAGGLVVIDYKTGRSDPYKRLGEAPWAIYAGAGRRGGPKVGALPRLQLPLYAHAVRGMAAEALGDAAVGPAADPVAVTAGYWFVTARENYRWLPLPLSDSVEGELRWTLAAISDGIAAGVFPAYPRPASHAAHCEYCGVDPHRSAEVLAQLRRKTRSPELVPWLGVGARELLPRDEVVRLSEDVPPEGRRAGRMGEAASHPGEREP